MANDGISSPAASLRVLLAVHTVADWGGLQDWSVGMVRGLVANGAEVVLVANNERIVRECADVSSSAFLIDWSRWEESVDRILSVGFDVIFTQPFKARELSLELGRRSGAPVVYMSHGNNSDLAYVWRKDVSKFLVASSSLIPMVRDFCGVEDVPIRVLPNGVPDAVFDRPVATYDERTMGGRFDFVLAARLMPDKLSQVSGIINVLSALLEAELIPSARVHVMGGGPSKAEFVARLERFASGYSSVDVEFHGWVSQEFVLDRLRTAIFSVAGGVTGAQSVALGTPCLGAGIRGICGVSTPANMDRVLGSNFGDHSARLNMSEEEIAADSRWVLKRENFEAFQKSYVPLMRRERTHRAIAARALDELASTSGAATR